MFHVKHPVENFPAPEVVSTLYYPYHGSMNNNPKTVYQQALAQSQNDTAEWHIANIVRLLEVGHDSKTLRAVIAEASQALAMKAYAETREQMLAVGEI